MNSKVRNAQSTGVIYHEDMVDQYCLWDPKYTECPERFTVILKRCKALGLLERCVRLPARAAKAEEIYWIHSPELLELLKKSETMSVDELEELASRFDFIYFCNATFRLSLLAAGSTINLVEAVCRDEVKNGMAIIRPPGHHAMKSAFCGYCYLNNVAMAANHALRNLNISRILIVDWDVHHGQATQQMFYHDPRVLYFSIHRFEDGTHWPNLKESNADYVGEGDGKGFNVNVPLNKIGLGNADYLTIFHQILLPLAVEYQPELILVSAGYDAALGCPEGEMEITPACYAHFIRSLSQLANGRLAVVLEGGYCLKSLAEGAALTLRALLGDPCPMIGPIGEVDIRTRETIMNVINCQKQYWKCFQIYDTYQPNDKDLSIADNFTPNLKFEYEQVIVEKYPTRDMCPINDEKAIALYDSMLDTLIKDTDLYIPEKPCLVYCLPANKISSLIQSDFMVNVNAFSKWYQMVPTILEDLLSKKINSAIVDGNSLRAIYENDTFCESALISDFTRALESKNYRVMLINFGSIEIKKTSMASSCGNLLQFAFDREMRMPTNRENNDFCIHFPTNMTSMNNNDYITAWFKVLFPVAYQFSPEIIIVYVDFNCFDFGTTGNVSVELLPHFLHWLTALSNGRVILVADYNNEDTNQQRSFTLCCETLSGTCNLPSIVMRNEGKSDYSDHQFIDDLKNLCRQFRKRWANLDYFVKYPSIK